MQDLEQNKTDVIFSNGRYQISHLIKDLLATTGPASLFIASYSISEEYIRFLLKQKAERQIKSLTLLLDFKTMAKGLHLSTFCMQASDRVFLGSNHSKVILLETDQWMITVVTSQNLTRGNRTESYMISTEKAIFETMDRKVRAELKNCIPINDVFKRAIGENPGTGRLLDET